MNNKGFTLAEVLAVVAIIAILALIATPSVLSAINASKNSSYEIMVDNIRTAAETMYKEIENFDGKFYNYDSDSNKGDALIAIQDNKLIVNFQTLVNYGFLKGVNNNDTAGENRNKKIILNPKDKTDIGLCQITITKKINDTNNKVCYKIEVDDNNEDSCPAYEDFWGDKQCQN